MKTFPSYLDSQSIVEQEIGGPVSDVDPDSYDDNLLNLVAGDPLHMFKFTNRVARELPDIVESLENLMGKWTIYIILSD